MKSLKLMMAALAALVVVGFAAPALAVNFTCTPAEIAAVEEGTTTNRVHVRCANSIVDAGDTVIYFAIPSAYTAHANRLITLATTALTTGRTLVFSFTTDRHLDLQGNNFGCGNNNCRYVVSILLL